MSDSLDIKHEAGRYRTGPSARSKLEFCIGQLEDADKFDSDLDWGSSVVYRLSIEEIVAALLHAYVELGGGIEGEHERP
jgi:hypothetical protein